MPTLRELRKKADLTQAALAEKTGLREATISALENGRSKPHQATIQALATALDQDDETILTALRHTRAANAPGATTDPIEQMAGDWPFLRGLDADLRTGLAQSLVAEWTHSSTALEGNTITAGDTLFVLTEGLTISGKSLREHQELHGHAQAIGLMAAWSRARQPVRITHLHDLHRAVQTGTVIDAFAPVGDWKIESNGTMAITTTGATRWHEYADPRHVPALIESWIKSLEQSSRPRELLDYKNANTPDSRAALLDAYTNVHLGFVGIHPYADGNGRMARLLANLPLLRAGLPPLLVNATDRRTYITLLGDYSLRRGQPLPGEDLVRSCPERDALRAFFADQWQSTLKLVAEFHQHQAKR